MRHLQVLDFGAEKQGLGLSYDKIKTMKAMDYNSVESFKGILITFILWVFGKILWLLEVPSIAQLASAATIISAIIVAVANAPRAIKAIKDFLNRKK